MKQHHAFLLFANSIEESAVPALYKHASIDVEHVYADRLSIDSARELSASAQRRPFVSQERVFVIHANEIAIDAQNALLKLFEEPPFDTLFYVVLKRTSYVLPTLLSRLHLVDASVFYSAGSSNETFTAFCALPLSKRLEIVAEKTKEKDMPWIENLLLGSESFVCADPLRYKKQGEALVTIRSYAGNKGASLKMLLEELSLLLP